MIRFSIRELLLVTMMVALATGWGVDRKSLIQAHERAVLKAMSKALKENPAATIKVLVDGRCVFSSTLYAEPSDDVSARFIVAGP